MHTEDPIRALRNALSRFATGVAVVTTTAADGRPVGLTINSFSAVSLEPPLVLWSLARRSPRLADFLQATHFTVNVLGEDQRALSERFSRPAEERFAGVRWAPGLGDAPRLHGCLASFECARVREITAGDHLILIGQVERFDYAAGAPLVFFASGYGLPAPLPQLVNA